jgi:hypothetical protein
MASRVGRGIALPFLDLGIRRGWVVNSTPQKHFTPEKSRYPLYRRLGGPQGQSGRGGKSRPTGIRSPYRSARKLSRYTDWATWTQLHDVISCFSNCKPLYSMCWDVQIFKMHVIVMITREPLGRTVPVLVRYRSSFYATLSFISVRTCVHKHRKCYVSCLMATGPQLMKTPWGPYTLSVKLSDFTVWRHAWRKNWINCAVLTGNSAGLRTVLSSLLSHK